MIRLPVSSPRTPGRAFRLVCTSLAVSLAFCAPPASAQYYGDTGTDLTSQSTTDIGQVNRGQASSQTSVQNGQDFTGADDDYGATPLTGQAQTSQQRQQQASLRSVNPLTATPRPAPYRPSEFELYVRKQATQDDLALSQEFDVLGRLRPSTEPIRRFGANLVTDQYRASLSQDPLPTIPGDYIVRPGDEIALTLWGSVNADLHLIVDRAGRVSVPRIGAISVGGQRNADLADVVRHRVAQTFRNFELSVSVGEVRAIRVFVGGFAEHPGSVTLNGLSSVLHAVMRAGGPSAAGSFRDIHLRRDGKEIATYDLYDLLLKGSRETDRLVQPDDVIFIGPSGPQVAVLGSVNQRAIYELKPGETLDDLLAMAGGFNTVADRARVTLERLADRTTGHVAELQLPAHGKDVLDSGDIVRAFSLVAASVPRETQNEHIRIEGEVARPGDYVLPPGSHVADALRLAGGMTPSAYPFGTEFSRESVRKAQELNYERALRDLETDMSRNQASQRATSNEEISAQTAIAAANERLLERLRQVRPTGRVVLQITPDSKEIPNLALEDGDTISIPGRGSSVGVFGSVFSTGSFVYEPNHTTSDYLALAGGATRGADKSSIFMIRANGSVISAQQGTTFWHSGSDFTDALVLPGDTIFVPEELSRATFIQNAKDWTQILYQFGLGLAGIKSLGL